MGLLSALNGKGGLGQKLGKWGAGGGGLLGGAHDALIGTTPQMTATSNDIQDERLGTLHRAPTVTPTGEMGGGLLDKLGGMLSDTDERGLTGRDKLFAMGSVMQGDSGGAASYLANQRQAADVLGERKRQQEMAAAGLAALQGAIDPATGQLDYRKYLAALPPGADPTAGLKVREGLQPDIAPISGPRGAVNLFDRSKGAFVPGGIEGENEEDAIAYAERLAEARARGGRRGAPPVGRSGGRSGGKLGSIPTDQLIKALSGG